MKLLDPNEFFRLSQDACVQIQRELSAQVLERCPVPLNGIQTAAGVDIAYWKAPEGEWAVCCIVVLEVQSQAILEEAHAAGKVNVPYIPGCFAFRELPLVLQAAARLKHWPDVFLFDGNGILHPRQMGLATHASFYLHTPTIGVAKRYFQVEGAEYAPPKNTAGSCSDIMRHGRILGRAVRTRPDVKPVFVSVGNYMDIGTATALVLRLTGRESHIPMPTRYADLATHQRRKEILARSETIVCGGDGI